MKYFIAVLLAFPFVYAADENCATSEISCELMDHAISTLKLKEQEMKKAYSTPEENKGLLSFEKDAQTYLSIHN